MWKTFEEILEQLFQKNLEKFQRNVNIKQVLEKLEEIILDFPISFWKSSRCEGKNVKYKQLRTQNKISR